MYRDWGSLEKEIKRRTVVATKETIYKGKEVLDKHLREFYDTDEPKRYERTWYLMRSGDFVDAVETANGAMGYLRMDSTTPYLTGTYSTMKVFQEAEIHGSRIIGNPHFWENTTKEIEESIMPRCFSEQGFRRI